MATHGSRSGSTKHPAVYWYLLASGATRYRCTWVSSDGTPEWKSGFMSALAAHQYRAEMVTAAGRGQRRTTNESFASLYEGWLRSKRGITEGTRAGYQDAYEKRLKPAFGDLPLKKMLFQAIDDAVTEWDQCGDWAPKTINNTIGALSSFMSDMARRNLIPQNPVQFIERLLDDGVERDWLRDHEIPRYLDACSDLYRPVAEFLVGTGVRISEALGVKLADLDRLDEWVVLIRRTRRDLGERERGRRGRGRAEREGATKGRDERRVAVGPALAISLRERAARVAEMTDADPRATYLFQMPNRERKTDLGRWEGGGPMDRNTISRDWHKDALQDAGLRDMPLHALRHTAAAVWLRDHDLEFVRRQLGHAQITTTQRIYGHLEQTVMAQRAAASERRRQRAWDDESDGA